MKHLASLLIGLAAALPVCAQNGDKAGEAQPPPPEHALMPPSPALPPTEALKSFRLPPGFRIETVAAEPLVVAPVAMTFDPDGRMWVLEMPGFMPNPDGKGEDQPIGKVVILTDTNGDGIMDERKVFLDGLVMARALALAGGGCLVAEPPKLWFARDTNGDDVADEKVEVAGNYGSQANPEHTSNGLMRGLDNWIYSANHTIRYRYAWGEWDQDDTVFRGQWGITQDDFGRPFYNSNSDQLRGDLAPSEYLGRNPAYKAAGANVQIARDQSVFPIRLTTGVNRGYQAGTLKNGKLARFTAACGPAIYRGNLFPAEFYGNAFVCEPSANFVRRNILTERDAIITATNAYPEGEFLASTDERFRPVNLYNGPDGALYVVDLYRGILQHRIYLTSYLRGQIQARGLETPLDMGRIYRVVPENAPPSRPARLKKASASELVKELENDNGWQRDTAQQLLVERNEAAAVPLLERMAAGSPKPLARLHALWTLEGLGRAQASVVSAALKDEHPKIRAAAFRLAEPLVRNGDAALREQMLALRGDSSKDVQLQLALTLGSQNDAKSDEALAAILAANGGHAYIRDAVISGLGGREVKFLEMLLASPAWRYAGASRDKALAALAQSAFSGKNPAQIQRLLDLAAQHVGWRRDAMLEGIVSTVPPAPRGRPAPPIKAVALPEQPAALEAIRVSETAAAQKRVDTLFALVSWPGKAGAQSETAQPLSEAEEKLFQAGKELYVTTCGACHQPHGNGQEGLAPPLADSDWTTGSPERLIRIVLHGVRGPIQVKGKTYEMDMPGIAVLEDEQIAALLTYVRREWGHTASAVLPETVKKTRADTAARQDAWTEADLLKIP